MFITGGDDHTLRLWPIHDVDPNEAELAARARRAADSDDEGGDGGGRPGSARRRVAAAPMVLREHSTA